MTPSEFNHLLNSIKALSPEQLRQLRQELESELAVAAGQPARADDESSGQALQRRLYEAGVLSEVKPPITDLTPYRDRQAVPIRGEPLSETVIRERR